MSQTKENTVVESVVSESLVLNVKRTDDGYAILTPESEYELLGFFNTIGNGQLYNPKDFENEQVTAMQKQTPQFQRAMHVTCLDRVHGIEYGTHAAMLEKIASMRNPSGTTECRPAETLADFIDQLIDNDEFKDLVRSMVQGGENIDYDSMTEKVVEAVAPMIEEIRLQTEQIKKDLESTVEDQDGVAQHILDACIDPDHKSEEELAAAETGTQIITAEAKPSTRGGDRTPTRRNNR